MHYQLVVRETSTQDVVSIINRGNYSASDGLDIEESFIDLFMDKDYEIEVSFAVVGVTGPPGGYSAVQKFRKQSIVITHHTAF